MGYYLPWAVFCGLLTAIGGGLFATLDPYTSVGKWIGFGILAGAGRGTGFQTVSLLQSHLINLLMHFAAHHCYPKYP